MATSKARLGVAFAGLGCALVAASCALSFTDYPAGVGGAGTGSSTSSTSGSSSCIANGQACSQANDCCSKTCAGACCAQTSQKCTTTLDCCKTSDVCNSVSLKCEPPGGFGATCGVNTDCVSSYCCPSSDTCATTCASAVVGNGTKQDLCGTKAATVYNALEACACAGPCMSACATSLGLSMFPDSSCAMCLQAADPGGCAMENDACNSAESGG